MEKKIILGFVGEMVSGKGTVAEYLKEKHGATTHRFSTMLRDVLNRLYLDISRNNMQRLSTVLRENFSQDIMAKVIAKEVEEDKSKVVVVEGIRRFADIEYLTKVEGFKLVYITTDMQLRYKRLTERSENSDDQVKTFEEFQKDHEHESESEIADVGAKADFTIDNKGNFEELYRQAEEILKKA